MRAHVFVWGLFTVLLCVAIGSLHQQRTSSQTNTVVSSTAHRTVHSSASPPTTWPGVSPAIQVSDLASESTSTSAEAAVSEDLMFTKLANQATAAIHPDGDVGKVAVITAQDANAEVNVRSLPSPNADSLGYGVVDDVVMLGSSETSEDGHVWHYVTFQDAATAGWVRSDFLDIPAESDARFIEAAPGKDVLKEALDEECGGPKAIAAYFMTQNYTIYLCQHRGQLVYLSQEKGTDQVIVSEDAQTVGGGYIIPNDNYEYRLDSSVFVVVRLDDKEEENEILRESVIYSERYRD
ncbi:MAG: hypothetical protein AAFY20_05815 [Cyanobacteria bacterium J06639_14]